MLVLWAASRTSRVPFLWLGMSWSTLNTPSWLAMMVCLSLSLSLSPPLTLSPSRLSVLLNSLIINFITATAFATQMGFPKEDLHTDYSWYAPPICSILTWPSPMATVALDLGMFLNSGSTICASLTIGYQG